MDLRTLSPKKGITLEELKALFDSGGCRAALPSALADPLLLRLAYDFRQLERGIQGNESGSSSVQAAATATYVVTKLLLGSGPDANRAKIAITERELLRAFETYQWGLEREIVGRALGLDTAAESQQFDAAFARWPR